mgnify:CR=1 FL=1
MRDKSLNDRIINVLIVAGKPLSAAAIRRALPDAVEASELSYRLTYLRARGDLVAGQSRREANTGPLCSWCDAVDVCPEGRKHVAWMVKAERKISPQTEDMLRRFSEPRELEDWVKFGHVRDVAAEGTLVQITPTGRMVTGDRWALRDGETPLAPPTVGELRSELAKAIEAKVPNERRIRFLELTLRRRGFEVERWEPAEAPKPKAKPRRKVQSATARTKSGAVKKAPTRRRKAKT